MKLTTGFLARYIRTLEAVREQLQTVEEDDITAKIQHRYMVVREEDQIYGQ